MAPAPTKDELFERLAQGRAAGITVVTPNTRLAQALQAGFDAWQAARGRTSWEAPDILPLGAFVARLYEDALYSERGTGLPVLLSAAQEHWRWQEVVSNSGLLAIADTAAQCRRAWQLAHEWRIRGAHGNEDAQAFAAWSLKYLDLTKGEVDAARLPDLVLANLQGVKKPQALVAYAFDILPPQTRQFLQAFGAEHCAPARKESRAARIAFATAKEELEAAARWARARLERDPAARIGVVIPDLELRRREVVRVFSRVMQPGCHLPGAPAAPLPFNVSLGEPLAQYPVVALALGVLQLVIEELPFEQVSQVVRSPFLGGAEKELAARARLEIKLRRRLGATVSLPKLLANVDGAPLLRALLDAVFALRPKEDLFAARRPSEWARHFSAILEAAGFPGERGLDSAEFQARAKWHEVLGELAKLDRVAGQVPAGRALAALRRLCAETPFQPAQSAGGGAAPVQVLGILESAGLEFDHLWVSGLTDEAWPLKARPNPFLPVALQKQAGVPEASAESSLELDRGFTRGWLQAAPEAVFSWFSRDKDRELSASPLIAAVAAAPLEVPVYPRLRDLVFAARRISTLDDCAGPALASRQVKGGTRVLSDQAACPFRAFAHWRLGAREVEPPAEGLDARKRGALLHELMKSLWAELKNSDALERDVEPAIERAAAAAVKALELEGRFAQLERERLARLAREWLVVERRRAPFEVVAIEQQRPVSIGGLDLETRIDRADRVAGGHVLLDYKTGRKVTANDWKVPRPDDPQLPLYAIAAKEDIAAVAFAKVWPGAMRFTGFSKAKNFLPDVRQAEAWEPMLSGWKKEAEALAGAFAAGEARVDPKRALNTCRYCDLHTACRVYEKLNPLKESEEAAEGGE